MGQVGAPTLLVNRVELGALPVTSECWSGAMLRLTQICKRKRKFQKQETLKYELRSRKEYEEGPENRDGESEPRLANSQDQCRVEI